MEPDATLIEIASEQFKHYDKKSQRKILQMLETELEETQRPGSFTGSGRVLELKTEIAAIKKLLKKRGNDNASETVS